VGPVPQAVPRLHIAGHGPATTVKQTRSGISGPGIHRIDRIGAHVCRESTKEVELHRIDNPA
jgi:hypothetical protein